MEEQHAQAVRDLVLSAITDLTRILAIAQEHCATAEMETMRRAVGGVIALIQSDILDEIDAEHPELDDLR